MHVSASTLICTVGTSLFYPNLKNLGSAEDYLARSSDADRQALGRLGLLDNPRELAGILTDIKAALDQGDFPRLGRCLARLPADLRLLGAEINSTDAMLRKKFIENPHRLVLLVSDTPDGQAIGTILTSYFTDPACEIPFDDCRSITVEGLQDQKPLVFQREGLTNLVRLMGEQARKWSSRAMAVNATGGYKAQIALAVAFGQATQCPVYYKHERFDQIIRFPKIPFTMDLSLVERHLKVWADLAEPGAVFDVRAMDRMLDGSPELREAIVPMLDSISEDETTFYSISALGMVYWEAFLARTPNAALPPPKTTQRQGCRFRDDHYPIGFKDYVQKIFDRHPTLISSCHSMDYSGQAAIRHGHFYVKGTDIVGEYVDRNRFGARFRIQTPASNALERQGAVDRLREAVLCAHAEKC